MDEYKAIKTRGNSQPRSGIKKSLLFKSVDDGPLIPESFIKRFSKELGRAKAENDGKRRD
jgi:hypothetical protein